GFVLLAGLSSIFVLIYFRNSDNVKSAEKFSHKEIFLKSYPIAISAMALSLLMCFDIMFLKKYRNDESVGIYSVGVKLMTIVSIIILSVNITVSAKIAECFAGQKLKELADVARNSARLIFRITLPIIVLISIFSESILSLFGHQYIAAKE